MPKKQLFLMFMCYLVPFITGNAILPFLPIYAERLGASSTVTGYYLAASFALLAFGTMTAGNLSNRFQRRKPFILVSAVMSLFGLFLMGLAPDLFLLSLATGLVWFCGGMLTTMILILVGLFAPPNERGKTFGILTMALPLGAIIGGTYSGVVINQFDYRGLFMLTGLLFFIPMVAVLFIQDKPIVIPTSTDQQAPKIPLGRVFWLLFGASMLAYVANFALGMIRPVLMNTLSFDSTAIASTIWITGLVTLPLPYFVGWLSDRIGRKSLMVVIYIMGVLGISMAVIALDLWHFWLSAVLAGTLGSSFGLGSALLTDIVDKQVLDAALSRYASSQWFGGVLGYLLAGILIDTFGLVNTLEIAIFVALLSSVLLIRIRQTPDTAMAVS